MAKAKATTAIETVDLSVNHLLSTPTAEEVQAKLSKGKMVAQVVQLAEGQAVEGMLIGPGTEVETTDDATGEPKQLNTWRMEHATGITIDLLSSHQLDKNLPELVGNTVFVQKLPKKQVGARQVNQFCIVDMG